MAAAVAAGENGNRRVAVIVVHGVADQKAGDTARSVVDLLISSAPPGVAYEAIRTDSFTLQVDPLQPQEPRPRAGIATPTSETRPVGKAWAQSYRSDFQRGDWGASMGASVGASVGAPGLRAGAAAERMDGDRGLAATNYLLTKYLQNGAVPEACESSRIELNRAGSSGPNRVDVYEMYWADLSRLSGALPRIVTELFTMVFRLSKLGRETVDEARGHVRDAAGQSPASWRWLVGLQAILDWGFVNLLALLFAQLGMLALVILPFGVLAPHQTFVQRAVGVAALAFGTLWLAYRRHDTAALWIAPSLLALLGAALLAFERSGFWLLGLFWLGALSLGLAAALRVSDDRFPLTRLVGLSLWSVTLALVIGHAAVHGWRASGRPPDLTGWVQAAIFGVEAVLFAVKLWWIAAAPVFLAWLVCGVRAARHGGYLGSASVGTGRLGFFVSLGTFVMLTMAAWALASALIDASVAGVGYEPSLFPKEEVTAGKSYARQAAERVRPPAAQQAAAAASSNASCPASCAASQTAAQAQSQAQARSQAQVFLAERYEDSASFFSLVAALLLSLVLYLASMFMPSVLAELNLLAQRARRVGPAQEARAQARRRGAVAAGRVSGPTEELAARRLGRWLTAGFRRLDSVVLGIVAASIAVSCAVGFVLLPDAPGIFGAVVPMHWSDLVAFVSLQALKPLVLSAAGMAAALSAFGGALSRYLPSLRAPLDIALDVDNYFREFPRRSIPRARIFSRYAALLKHVAAQGYERIVIVSHSQGTVISAEVLRFLSDAGPALPPQGRDRAARLHAMWGAELRLLTLGCPLRQLYAARFPALYGWVLATHDGVCGPKAADIGVGLWANAFTSGDYVGRWLWSDTSGASPMAVDPMLDTVRAQAWGRTDAYSAFNPMPPTTPLPSTTREVEFCLGVGAHTHYLEPDQTHVAWMIDHLVSAARA